MNFKIHCHFLFPCLLRAAFCLLSIAYCSLTNAQTNGTQYPITDPRNPNCPCHEQQKKAEEEYRQLLAKENKNQVQQVDQESFNVQHLLSQYANEESGNIFVSSSQLEETSVNKPEINFSRTLMHFPFKGYAGAGYKYKSSHWKKASFRLSKKIKHIVQHKKKVRVKHSSCFRW